MVGSCIRCKLDVIPYRATHSKIKGNMNLTPWLRVKKMMKGGIWSSTVSPWSDSQRGVKLFNKQAKEVYFSVSGMGWERWYGSWEDWMSNFCRHLLILFSVMSVR